jgi:hypothetical protein
MTHEEFFRSLQPSHPGLSWRQLSDHIGRDARHLADYRRAMTAPAPAKPQPPLQQLDHLARVRAAEKGISFHEAYQQVLNTPAGRQLYERWQAERSRGQRG